MSRIRFSRFLAVFAGAIIIASCSGAGISDPNTNQETLTAPATDPSKLDLRAVWWKSQYPDAIKVSKTIDQSGGTISIPETGLTLSFPAGAVTGPLTVTVTADPQYVAYKMEPTGTQFLKDVTATQLLNTTTLFGLPLRSSLYVAYIADDSVNLGGKVSVLEIEPSTTIFSVLPLRLPQEHVWTIRHFSRYMLASG